MFHRRRRASAKALRQEGIWHIQRIARKQVCLGVRAKGRGIRDEVRSGWGWRRDENTSLPVFKICVCVL